MRHPQGISKGISKGISGEIMKGIPGVLPEEFPVGNRDGSTGVIPEGSP